MSETALCVSGTINQTLCISIKKCCTGMTVSTEELVTTAQESVPVLHIW